MTKLQKQLLALKKLRDEQTAAFKAIEGKDDPTADELTAIKTRNGEIATLQKECDDLQELAEMKSANEKGVQSLKGGFPLPGSLNGDGEGTGDGTKSLATKHAEIKSLARSSRLTALKNFKGEDADVQAYKFARFYLASIIGHQPSIKFCQDYDIEIKAQNEGNNSAGGVWVPEEFGTTIIDLRETFGVFDRNAYIEPMGSDTKSVPRRTGGLTAYWEGESKALIESQMTWDRVKLVAKKLTGLAIFSNEVNEDALVNLGDLLAGDLAYAFSISRDQAGFNGDGTSAHGGIQGLLTKLKGLSGTIANIAGLVVGSGNLWSELVLADFLKVKGRLPEYAYKRGTPKWYCHQNFYNTVMEALALAAGGVSAAEVMRGADQKVFLGYPVEIAQALPSSEANSQIPVVFGNLALSSTVGNRKGMAIAVSTEFRFGSDEMAIRGIERVDINNHDVGNASGTASQRVPGPVVGLITAAS